MSDLLPPTPPGLQDDEAWLAVEYVLGLLDGAGREEALRRLATDPVFALEVEAWSARLAPLLTDIAPVQPDDDLWPRIAARLEARPAPALATAPRDNVVPFASRRPAGESDTAALRRQLGFWRSVGAAGVAASLSLAVLIGYRRLTAPTIPIPPPATAPPPALIVATLKPAKGAGLYFASWDPLRRTVLVALPEGVSPPDRSPELWLIGPGGKPAAVGVVRSGGVATLAVPAELAGGFRSEAVLAVSIEAPGGSPTGRPQGPVVASGPLHSSV